MRHVEEQGGTKAEVKSASQCVSKHSYLQVHPAMAGTRLGQARSQELSLGLPDGWQEPRSSVAAASRMSIIRHMKQSGREANTEPRCSI